jgi:hypothetical protein
MSHDESQTSNPLKNTLASSLEPLSASATILRRHGIGIFADSII